MEHLTTEGLARLVDEAPTVEERGHLNRCRRCRDELDALQAQTLGLSHLPDLRPPRGDWESLEVRLRGEGLLRNEGDISRHGRGRWTSRSPWLQAAAAALLLVVGAGAGAGGAVLAGGGSSPALSAGTGTPSAGTDPRALASLELPQVQAALGMTPASETLSLEEAEALVRATESWYLSALLRYRERADGIGGIAPGDRASAPDPISRFAALEALMLAGQAAIREAPTDPFLNGLMVNVRAEREAALRGMQAASTPEGVWY